MHSNAFDYASLADRSEAYQQDAAVFASTVFESDHPVVRVHPETGERAPLIGGFARHLRGLGSGESADILRILQHHVTTIENTVRWRWRVGDVAFWDNRATQHYAVADYGDRARHLQRITVAGDLAVGVDGRPSVALRGDSSAYTPQAA